MGLSKEEAEELARLRTEVAGASGTSQSGNVSGSVKLLTPAEAQELAALRAEVGQAGAPPAAATSYGAEGFKPMDLNRAASDVRADPDKNRNEMYPDWADMPELNEASWAMVKARAGTSAAFRPEDIKGTLEYQFPYMKGKIKEDNGYLLIPSRDGETYAYKPGLRRSDITRTAGNVAALAGAAGLATLLAPAAPVVEGAAVVAPTLRALMTRAALAAGAGQVANEGIQYATGGEANPGDVLSAMGVGGLIPAAGAAGRAIANRIAPSTFPKPPVVVAGALPAAPVAAPVAAAPPSSRRVLELTVQAARGDAAAATELRAMSALDPDAMAAASRLGILENVTPGQMSTNPVVRQIEQTAAGPTSALRAAEESNVNAIMNAVEEAVAGGPRQPSEAVSGAVKSDFKKRIARQQAKVDEAYGIVSDPVNGMPQDAQTPAHRLMQFVAQKEKVQKTGKGDSKIGELLTQLKSQLKSYMVEVKDAATGKLKKVRKYATYGLVDQLRKDVGDAISKRVGPFKDANRGLLKQIYKRLDHAQLEAVRKADPSGGLAKALREGQKAVRIRKAVETKAVKALGNQRGVAPGDLKGSIVTRLNTATRMLATGDDSAFMELLDTVRKPLRSQVVKDAILSMASGRGDKGGMSPVQLMNWANGAQKNAPKAFNRMMDYLAPAEREGLRDGLKVVGKLAEYAKGRTRTGWVEEGIRDLEAADRSGFGQALMGLITGTVERVPFVGRYLAAKMGRENPRTMAALSEFLVSPAGRAAFGMGGPPPVAAAPGAMAQRWTAITASPQFKRLAAAAGSSPAAFGEKLRERMAVTAAQSSIKGESKERR